MYNNGPQEGNCVIFVSNDNAAARASEKIREKKFFFPEVKDLDTHCSFRSFLSLADNLPHF
jgi:hypothetical protein